VRTFGAGLLGGAAFFAVAFGVGLVTHSLFPGGSGYVGIGLDARNLPGTVLGLLAWGLIAFWRPTRRDQQPDLRREQRVSKRPGEVVADLVGGLLQLGGTALLIFGIYSSFHRHGVGHGVVAIIFPPYALYRGVAAAVWEKPEWKEKWDENTEALGYVLEGVAWNRDSDEAIKLAKNKAQLKSWIESLPERERTDLRRSAENYANAMSQLLRNAVNDTADGVPMRPVTDPGVAVFVSRFQNVSGLRSAWNRLQADIGPLRTVWEKTMSESEPADQVERFRNKQVSLQMVESRSVLMASTVEELFRK
jgi:hypothetical protein